MRIICYFQTKTTTTQIGAPTQKCRIRLAAVLLAALISLVAIPVNAQSTSLNGCRRTDSHFSDRLRATTDWLVGIEFPLFCDSATCGLESKVAAPSTQELSPVASVDLEQEILQSVCNVFHLDPCEAFPQLWAPAFLPAESKPSTTVPAGRSQVVHTIDRSYELGLGLASAAASHFERLSNEFAAQRDNLWEQLGIDEVTTLGPADLPEFHWPMGSLVNALNIDGSTTPTSSSWSDEPSIQPIPTASYVGLQKAIDGVTQNLGVQIRFWKNHGELAVHGAAWLVELQNEAIERIVLEQFDAILR